MVWTFFFLINFVHSKSGPPVSQSFTSLKKCYPDLATKEFEGQVDLDLLKDKIDQSYLSAKTNLRFRRMTMWDGSETRRLTIRAKSGEGKKFEYEMLLEKIDDKGVASDVDIPAKHRLNPTQSDINIYIINNDMKMDETSYIDTKLNGAILSFKKNFKQVQELEFSDSQGKRTLTCENQKNLGVVCTCK